MPTWPQQQLEVQCETVTAHAKCRKANAHQRKADLVIGKRNTIRWALAAAGPTWFCFCDEMKGMDEP